MSYPWTDEILRPVSHVPDPPEKVNPRYCLYTRNNVDICQVRINTGHRMLHLINYNELLLGELQDHLFFNLLYFGQVSISCAVAQSV
jgi:hypothetical protein